MTASPSPAPSAALAPVPGGSFTARRGSRLPSLTGMRWWAALAVFVLHALVFLPTFPFYASERYDDLARWVPMQVGASGVAFFFVLSGFIMYWTRRPRDTARGFIRRRVRKIYPTHIVAVLILLLVLPVPLGRTETWVPCLLLIQTWWPDWTTLGGLNVPAWSLASEMLFYLLFPFVVPWIDRIGERWVPHAIAALFSGIVLLHTAFYLWADGYKGIDNLYGARTQLPPAPDRTPEYEIHGAPVWFAQDYIGYADHGYWLSYYFPVARLPEFFLGVLVCRLVVSGRWRVTSMRWPLVSLAAAFALTWVVPVNFKMSVVILLPTAAVIATACVRDLRGRGGLNATKPMVWFGDVSYAFYLMQYPVMVVLTKYLLFGEAIGFEGWLGAVGLSLVLSLASAAATFHFVDKPITGRPGPSGPGAHRVRSRRK